MGSRRKDDVREAAPVLTADLFPELHTRLLELLRGLSDVEWQQPTVCDGWSVKDLAAHLLADELGNLSRRRDGFVDTSLLRAGEDLTRQEDLLRFINALNESWVAAARRLSPRILCELLEWSGAQFHAYVGSLDPFATGAPVSWAGPEPAPVWLDVAREYTERWHHQQQIREATRRPGLTERTLFAPVLDTFVWALPHTYRDVGAGEGTCVALTISGDAGGRWWLVRGAGRWRLAADGPSAADAAVTMDQDVAWRLFTKGMSPREALSRATLDGDRELALRALDTVSIIA